MQARNLCASSAAILCQSATKLRKAWGYQTSATPHPWVTNTCIHDCQHNSRHTPPCPPCSVDNIHLLASCSLCIAVHIDADISCARPPKPCHGKPPVLAKTPILASNTCTIKLVRAYLHVIGDNEACTLRLDYQHETAHHPCPTKSVKHRPRITNVVKRALTIRNPALGYLGLAIWKGNIHHIGDVHSAAEVRTQS